MNYKNRYLYEQFGTSASTKTRMGSSVDKAPGQFLVTHLAVGVTHLGDDVEHNE